MNALRANPVAVSAAVAALLEAILGLAMSLGWMSPEVGTPIMTLVAASVGLVKVVVTPVAKVAKVLDRPVGVVDELLRKVKL